MNQRFNDTPTFNLNQKRKMKTILLFTLLSITFVSVKAQTSTLPYREGKVVYEKIAELTGINKEEIYSGAKKWLADSFKSSKNVIQSENETTGQIIGKGTTSIYDTENSGIFVSFISLKFSIQIDCKDSKYRMRFYDLQKHSDASGLYVPETNMPIEEFDKITKGKKALARWELLTSLMNKQFEAYMVDFDKSLQKSSKDDF